MRGLYAIVDVDFAERRGVEPLALLDALLEGAPAAVQIRAKSLGAGAHLALLRAAVAACRGAGVPVYANDRPDLAVLSGCVGVHVGQDDLSVPDVRRFAPALEIGVSTHDRTQLDAALALSPDYVAFGPVFATTSKQRPDPVVGLEGLAEAAARVAGRIPLVAIGGIDLARAAEVARWASAWAVIGALVPEGGLAGTPERARALGRPASPR
jgi:thiamine-phosphate pyrophosphorylase